MQNLYSRGQMKKACSIVDDDGDDYENVSDISRTPAVPMKGKKIDTTDTKGDLRLKSCDIFDDDDDDEDDYENASNLGRTPTVPAREKKIEITAKIEDLPLKCLPTPVNTSWNQDLLSVVSGVPPSSTRPGPLFQPPPIGLDFSSPAVNAAFKDLPDEPGSNNNHGSGWMKWVLVMCLILIFSLITFIIALMTIYYPSISNQLSDIKLNVSEIQETARIDRKMGAEDLKQVNQTFEKKIDNIQKDILTMKRDLGLCKTCLTQWTLSGFTCYYLSTSPMTWDDSRKDCIKRDSTLLTVKTQKELVAVKNISANKRFWIGLRKVQNVWRWMDNTEPIFTSWNPGEPNNYLYVEHCTEMITGKWNDLECSQKIDYICQRLADC